VLLHNYAIQYVALAKYKGGKTPFWTSAAPLTAIKPKFESYLKGIDYRLKLLEENPRLDIEKTSTSVTVRGLFSVYDRSKTYQSQPQSNQRIDLAMDELQCRAYGDCSRAFAKDIDVSSEKNINALAALAVMELQFMHGCAVDWSKRGGDGGTASGAASSQVLTSGSIGDDADEGGEDGGEGKSSGGEGDESEEEFDFSKIDVNDVVAGIHWDEVDYEDAAEFMSCRESFAMAILFFLCEELGKKQPKLKDQVHAGWLHTFHTPITIDQLYDRPKEITFEFTEDEEEWFRSTIRFFVSEMPAATLEQLGITTAHLNHLDIPPPSPPSVSPNPCPNCPSPSCDTTGTCG